MPVGKRCFYFRAGLRRRDVPDTATDRDTVECEVHVVVFINYCTDRDVQP